MYATWVIEDELLHTVTEFTVATSGHKFRNAVNQEVGRDIIALGDILVSDGCCEINKDDGTVYIWVPTRSTTRDNIITLVHESLHAAHFHLTWRGFNVKDEDEPLAYLQGFILEGIFDALRGPK